MNFFDHQDAARRSTRRLVVLFILSVVGVIAMLYLPIALYLVSEEAEGRGPRGRDGLPAWLDPGALAVVAGGAITLISLGALVRRVQFAGGGRAVAESLGGRWLSPSSASPAERRLLDTVEEMSIASGMPVPPVAIIEDESINAFAAGTTPANAVLGFTRGALNRLTRDELQGVVAHEFSHIAHGDMRLNIRLACAVAGVMVLVLIGRVLFHVAARAPRTRSRKGDATAGLLLVGLALVVAGSIGAFFGRILQAAVSRQREYLADASAAQYTRNPRALAAALRRIAGLPSNTLDSAAASGLNHFFFTSAASAWLATHPPIGERIRRLEGSANAIEAPMRPEGAPERTESAIGFAPQHRATTTERAVPDARTIDAVTPMLKRTLPPRLIEACREPFDAQAVLLLSAWGSTDEVRERQRDVVRANLGPAMAATVSRLRPAMSRVPEPLLLTVLDLCMPALQQLSQRQYRDFRAALGEVMRADGKVSLMEWTLRSALARRVEVRFGALGDAPGRATIAARLGDAHALLSTVAHAPANGRAREAYRRGAEWIRGLPVEPLAAERCSLDALDHALERLAELNEAGRHCVVEAVATAMSEDGAMHTREDLLLRGIADRLGVLLPSAVDSLEQHAPGAALDGKPRPR